MKTKAVGPARSASSNFVSASFALDLNRGMLDAMALAQKRLDCGCDVIALSCLRDPGVERHHDPVLR
jgi:Asp/Glu/hydantoin racemase